VCSESLRNHACSRTKCHARCSLRQPTLATCASTVTPAPCQHPVTPTRSSLQPHLGTCQLSSPPAFKMFVYSSSQSISACPLALPAIPALPTLYPPTWQRNSRGFSSSFECMIARAAAGEPSWNPPPDNVHTLSAPTPTPPRVSLPPLSDALRDFDKEFDDLLLSTTADEMFDHGDLFPRLPAVPLDTSFALDVMDVFRDDCSLGNGGERFSVDLSPAAQRRFVPPLVMHDDSGSGSEGTSSPIRPKGHSKKVSSPSSLYMPITPPPSYCHDSRSPSVDDDAVDTAPLSPRPKRPLNAFILWSCEVSRP
jgi:hypothetical protein